MSWNQIAQIESSHPLEALDEFARRHTDRLEKAGPPAEFKFNEVFESLKGTIKMPSAGTGVITIDRVNLLGQPLPASAEASSKRFSILSLLTQQQVKPIMVELPARLSARMLVRVLTYQDKSYRMDLFGGNSMKSGRVDLKTIFSQAPVVEGAAKKAAAQKVQVRPGHLFALPIVDTLAHSSFTALMSKLFPNKEAFFYFQRLLMASPPSLPGLAPEESVLTGTFNISLLPDRPLTVAHPFQITIGKDKLALQPHDGCGFIKQSVAQKMGQLSKAARAKAPYGAEQSANLPVQALQHYPRSLNTDIEEETKRVLEQKIQALESANVELDGETKFRAMSTGLTKGNIAVALPSNDGKVHLPWNKFRVLKVNGLGVLIGKSPYDKPNLIWFSWDQIAHGEDDPTSKFLSECLTLQYSFVGRKEDSTSSNAPSLMGAKGLLVVVPDEAWPEEFESQDFVMSGEDPKVDSEWIDEKRRVTVDTGLKVDGILQITDVFAPGSCVGMPIDQQKRLDGDFDGDPLILIEEHPALQRHVQECDVQQKKVPSLKPAKSHTSAFKLNAQTNEKEYEFARGAQILATTQGVMQLFTGLQQKFLAQPAAQKQAFAQRAIFGAFEGLPPVFKQKLYAHLDEHEALDPKITEELVQLLDADKSKHAIAKKVIALTRASLMAPDGSAPEPIDEEIAQLFPALAIAYASATTPLERLLAVVDHYPKRHLPDFAQLAYQSDDALQSVLNLMSLGIKVGTDAYKSDTAVFAFRKVATFLTRATAKIEGWQTHIPYSKGLARQLHAGSFDPQASRQSLQSNPTLAAQIMHSALDFMESKKLLSPASSTSTAQPAAQKPRAATSRGQRTNQATTGWKTEAEKLFNLAVAKEKDISPIVLSEAQKTNAKFPFTDSREKRKLVLKDSNSRGFDEGRLFKSKKSIENKAKQIKSQSSENKLELSNAQAVAKVNDALRYELVYGEENIAGNIDKMLNMLKGKGFELVKLRNHFKDVGGDALYRGVNVDMSKDGFVFEIQFHTEKSIEAKNDNHLAYKKWQNKNDSKSKAQMIDRIRKVPIPDGISKIVDQDER